MELTPPPAKLSRIVLLAVAVAGTSLILFVPGRLGNWAVPAGAFALLLPLLYFLITGVERVRSIILLSFLTVLAISGFVAPQRESAEIGGRRPTDSPARERAMELVSEKGDRLYQLAGELAREVTLLDGFGTGWDRDSRIAAFTALEKGAERIGSDWKEWGLGMEIRTPADGPVAWWGDVPALDEPRHEWTVSILPDPSRLHLVAQVPVSLPGDGDDDPAGTVRLILPVGPSPSIEGSFGPTLPFAEWLNGKVSREVTLFPSGAGRGKAIRGTGGEVIGRADIREGPPGRKSADIAGKTDLVCRSLLLLFWFSLLPWNTGRTGGKREKTLRESVAEIPIFPIILLRILFLLFDLPNCFMEWGEPGVAGGSIRAFLSRLTGSPADLVLSAATLLAIVFILRERLVAGRRKESAAAPLRPHAVAATLLLLSLLTAAFWTGLPALVATSPEELFAGPAHSGSARTVLLEFAIFLIIASYLLLVDAGFVWATRFGLIGHDAIARLSLPLRFLISALFGTATLLLSQLAIGKGWIVPLAPVVTVATGLLLLFLLRGRGWRLWIGLGFVIAAALVAHSPVRIAQSAMDRIGVEKRALRFAEPRDKAKRLVLEEALRFFMEDEKIIGMLSNSAGGVNERSAFYAWIRSGLSRHDHSCDLKILDRQGAVTSSFSMDMPAASPVSAAFVFRELRGERRLRIVESRRRIRNEIVYVYTGAAPVFQEDELVGAVIVSIPYFIDNLEYASKLPGASSEIFRNYRAEESSFSRYPEEIHVLHYEGDNPVRSSSDQPPPLAPPSAELIARLDREGSFWQDADAAGKAYQVFYTTWNDPDREGVLAFAIPKRSLLAHVFPLIDMILTSLLFSALLVVGLFPAAIAYSLIRRPGAPILVELTFEDRLVIAFLLIALLPAVLLGGAGRRMVGNYVREAGENEARASLQTVRYALEQETIREAEELARSTFVRRRVLEIEEDGLVDLELGLKRFGIFSPEGELILQNGRIGAVDPEALREVRDRRLPVTWFEGDDPFSIVALVGIVIEGFETDLKGVLLLSKPIDEAWTVSLGERVGKDLTFFTGGEEATSTRSELYQAGVLPRRLPSSVYLSLELRGEKVRFGSESIAGTPYLVGYGVMRDYYGDAVGTLAVPLLFRESEARGDVTRAYAAITYLTFLTVIFIMIVAVLMGQRIARPIAELTRGMARIASGRLDFTIARRAGGEIGRLVDSFNQMTRELHVSREALTERTRFIETILRSVAAGVIAFDRSDRVASLNPAAGRFLDLRAEEAQSKRIDQLPGQRIVAFQAILADLDRSGGGLLESEIELPGDEGKITLRVVGSRLTDHEGDELGKVVVFEDLTTLIQSKKLLAWGEMARQVAHEIKNPLTPIKLSAQQIRRAYHDRHERFGQILDESTDLIIEEIESLRKIATEFSAFARMPRREIEQVQSGALIAEVARLYDDSLGEGRIVTELPDNLPVIRVDREEIRRVLINLFENAVQATGSGGEIRVSAGRGDGSPGNDEGWEIWESTPEKPQPGELLVIRIRDDGPGVSDGARGKLFEPNFSTKTDGTGLGLAISRSIVEGYGGSIVIGSTPGQGSVAIVSLPV